jgi:hypothetical protein
MSNFIRVNGRLINLQAICFIEERNHVGPELIIGLNCKSEYSLSFPGPIHRMEYLIQLEKYLQCTHCPALNVSKIERNEF